jgi:hypothetical protein
MMGMRVGEGENMRVVRGKMGKMGVASLKWKIVALLYLKEKKKMYELRGYCGAMIAGEEESVAGVKTGMRSYLSPERKRKGLSGMVRLLW